MPRRQGALAFRQGREGHANARVSWTGARAHITAVSGGPQNMEWTLARGGPSGTHCTKTTKAGLDISAKKQQGPCH